MLCIYIYLYDLYTYDPRLQVYKEYLHFNARGLDFSLRNVCFGSKSWHWILGFREVGHQKAELSAGFSSTFVELPNWLVWWKGGDPQTVQHYEKVLQERFFFFGFFGWKSWIRDGIAKNLEGTEERAASNSSFTSSTQIREVPQGARIAQVENGIFVDICGWLKSTIWWRSQKINLNMIWFPALFGNFFGYLQCIRQTFDRIKVKPWCMLQDSSMSELRSMSTGSSPSLRVSWSCTYHLDNLFLRSLTKHLEYLGTSTRISTMFESFHAF